MRPEIKLIIKEREKLLQEVLERVNKNEFEGKIFYLNRIRFDFIRFFDDILKIKSPDDFMRAVFMIPYTNAGVKGEIVNVIFTWRFGLYHNENNYANEIEIYLKSKRYTLDGTEVFDKETYQSEHLQSTLDMFEVG